MPEVVTDATVRLPHFSFRPEPKSHKDKERSGFRRFGVFYEALAKRFTHSEDLSLFTQVPRPAAPGEQISGETGAFRIVR